MNIEQIRNLIIKILSEIKDYVNQVKKELQLKSAEFLTFCISLFRKHGIIEFYENNYSIYWKVNSKNKDEWLNVFKNYAIPAE